MQDQDVPPEAEGEADDGEDAVPRTPAASPAATASSTAAFTALPWTTATAPH